MHTFGDVHIYHNHMDQVREQIGREPRPFPKMHIETEGRGIFDLKFEDFILEDYNPHPPISAPIAV